MTALRPAVFLDRDGTVNVDTNYVRRAEDVMLIAGAAEAIRRLNEAGWPVIIITNQSGIGRGIFSRDDYELVRARIEALLAEHGARIDATYICPHAPAPSPETACDCRKPGTALHRQAAADHAIDLTRSWYIGDRWRDIAPALSLGGHGILVPHSGTSDEEVEHAANELVVANTLGEAVGRILQDSGFRMQDAGETLQGRDLGTRGSP
jgi:D-glycero-D-manno-heptose 1,7-bisphosphate phosphatase